MGACVLRRRLGAEGAASAESTAVCAVAAAAAVVAEGAESASSAPRLRLRRAMILARICLSTMASLICASWMSSSASDRAVWPSLRFMMVLTRSRRRSGLA